MVRKPDVFTDKENGSDAASTFLAEFQGIPCLICLSSEKQKLNDISLLYMDVAL